MDTAGGSIMKGEASIMSEIRSIKQAGWDFKWIQRGLYFNENYEWIQRNSEL